MTGMTGPWKEALPGVDAGRSGGGAAGHRRHRPQRCGVSVLVGWPATMPASDLFCQVLT